jgi:hypothetical protein
VPKLSAIALTFPIQVYFTLWRLHLDNGEVDHDFDELSIMLWLIFTRMVGFSKYG